MTDYEILASTVSVKTEISQVRPVRVLTTGGTIEMSGEGGARPEPDSQTLAAGVPTLSAFSELEFVSLANLPSSHLSLSDQLTIARAARDAARDGCGVVVTHGTDVLEETAMLSDLLNDTDLPIVYTGAIRPASAPGADGPANLIDAVAVAAGEAAAGLGAVVVFGGEIHHARCVRKTDATSVLAFSSPQTGPIGRVSEGSAEIWLRVERNPPLDPGALGFDVPIVPTTAGDDGAHARAVLAGSPDGVVIVTLGGGHVTPAVLHIWADAAAEMPVVACSRPERGAILRGTYGYAGSEQDLRAAAIVPAGFLSPQAARMKVLACLGAGLGSDEIRAAFVQDDA